jgi:5-methylcytosine-specific restriction protein B
MSSSDEERWKSFREAAEFEVETYEDEYEDPFELMLMSLQSLTPVVLYGPPGTGKTRLVTQLTNYLQEQSRLGKLEVVQFHRRFSYEDFIEGYTPTDAGFDIKDGVFKSFCKSPSKPPLVDVFVIDEMNRADLAATLGETLYALEDRGERSVKTAHFGDSFRIPANLLLIGTMNTADKSIAQIDFAVRRRFRFIPLFPDYEQLRQWLLNFNWTVDEFSLDDYVHFARRTNGRILRHKSLGPHMQLGQSVFVPADMTSAIDTRSLVRNFRECILSQVEAYLGLGNIHLLSEIFGPTVANEFAAKRDVSRTMFAGLVRESLTDRS